MLHAPCLFNSSFPSRLHVSFAWQSKNAGYMQALLKTAVMHDMQGAGWSQQHVGMATCGAHHPCLQTLADHTHPPCQAASGSRSHPLSSAGPQSAHRRDEGGHADVYQPARSRTLHVAMSMGKEDSMMIAQMGLAALTYAECQRRRAGCHRSVDMRLIARYEAYWHGIS